MGRISKAMARADAAGNEGLADAWETAEAPAPSPSPIADPALNGRPQDLPAGTDPLPAFRFDEQDQTGRPPTAAGWDERLVAALGTASGVAEGFRRLRTHILHPPGGERPPRTILVASAAPEEGKTFVCAGLAVTLAQGVEEHALSIDCDLRRPALAAMFGLGSSQGLADHLRSGVDLGRLIRKTGVPKLSIISSGPPPVNPAELLGSERLAAMIREVASRYPDRYILFDSPPLGKAAETAILAKQVDGVVLVVREGKSRREEVRNLVETIGPEKIIGVVFNAYQATLLERRGKGAHDDYYAYRDRKQESAA